MKRLFYYVEAETHEAAIKEVKKAFSKNYEVYRGVVFKNKDVLQANLNTFETFDIPIQYYNKNKIIFNIYSLDVIKDPEKQFEYDVKNGNIFCVNCVECEECIGCVDCNNSKFLYECYNCKDCNQCRKCGNCIECQICEDCTNCKKCIQCYKCDFCSECKSTVNCIYCENRTNDKDL